MALLDVVLALVILAFAASGYRQGFVVGALSFAGFFSGALIGLQLGPLVANQFVATGVRLAVSLIAIFGLAVAGQALAGWLGARLRHAIQNRSLQVADDVGGAVISLLAVVVVTWLVAVPLSVSSLPWLAKSVRSSVVLGTVDEFMPDQAKALSGRLRDTVDTRGFPNVFSGLRPTRVREVPLPNQALPRSQAVQDGRRTVVKVLGTAPTCARRIEGSGFIYAPERIMTNAHVVAGVEVATVEVNGDRYDATVVVFDPRRDLAVLYVPDLLGPVMPFAPQDLPTGADAIVLGFPLDGPYNAQAARIRDLGNVPVQDIYETTDVTREIYTIRALVRSGNSGGPLTTSTGQVVGVIFAAAADDPNTGYAVSAEEAAPIAAAGRQRDGQVGTGNCT